MCEKSLEMCICIWPKFDCPEVTLCGWQNIKIQLLLLLHLPLPVWCYWLGLHLGFARRSKMPGAYKPWDVHQDPFHPHLSWCAPQWWQVIRWRRSFGGTCWALGGHFKGIGRTLRGRFVGISLTCCGLALYPGVGQCRPQLLPRGSLGPSQYQSRSAKSMHTNLSSPKWTFWR